MLILLKRSTKCVLKLIFTMNNAGEFSSGCESGWTGYLEKSWLSPNYSISCYEGEDHDGCVGTQGLGEEEEDDMSMLSDASSGPPHFKEDSAAFNFNNHLGCSFYPSVGGVVVETNVVDNNAGASLSRRCRGTNKKLLNKDVKKKQMMMLDDTASSKPFPHHLIKKNEVGLRNKSQNLIENHRMLDLSHGFSSTHIKDGRPAMDLFGHQYQLSHVDERKWKCS